VQAKKGSRNLTGTLDYCVPRFLPGLLMRGCCGSGACEATWHKIFYEEAERLITMVIC